MRAAFSLTTLLGAALLFLVQPMVARMALPLLGGSPAVWTTCMLFFQAVLLAGYLYTHLLTTYLRPRAQALVHLGLFLAGVWFLPIRFASVGSGPAIEHPVLWLLGSLAISVGIPFFALSATGPLMQRWLYASAIPAGRDPYWLYAAGNLGSLGALLSYPLLLEPALALGSSPRAGWLSQSLVWSGGYGVFGVLLGLCAAFVWRQLRGASATGSQDATAPAPEPISAAQRLRWLLLAFTPSSAFLAVTQYLSSDVAVFPLLWVLPLSIYLVTFVLAFSRRSWISPAFASAGLAVTAVGVAASFWAFRRPYPWVLFVLHPLTLFFIGIVCHGRLARSRPGPERLTEFYLWVAIGGVLGGAFNALLAPRLFNSVAEYPLILLAACLMRPGGALPAAGLERRARVLDIALPAGLLLVVAATRLATWAVQMESIVGALLLQVAVPSVLALLLLNRPVRFTLGLAVLLGAAWAQPGTSGDVLYAERDFFGVHRVIRRHGPSIEGTDATGRRKVVSFPFHFLSHGTTRHGAQALEERLRRTPTSYYHRTGPIGQVFLAFEETDRLDRVAVIGLGAGTLAAYGREGKEMTFYEIDPEVVRIARDERFFTYLRDSPARVNVVIGDGRLALAQSPDGLYGLIVLDAFSSDAVPVHLMTQEAIELYFRKLRPQGLLAAHLTNQHLDLEPVFHAIAARLGLAGIAKTDPVATIDQMIEGKDRSRWVVLARDRADLAPIDEDADWARVPWNPELPPDRRVLWTDDYSSVLRALRAW